MIPELNEQTALPKLTLSFLNELQKQAEFKGEISTQLSNRLLEATDNSVYQVLPDAIIFPKSEQDIVIIMRLAGKAPYQSITFAPRGGGTGTNGQSLCSGIIIDCSKYLNKIQELNLDENYVVVEPGVVLDQLNDFLRPHNKFFAPTLSPSSRATLGGMVNTDACGKGSRLYGKTSQHVLALTAVYLNGEVHTSFEIEVSELPSHKSLPGRVGQLYQQLEQTVTEHKQSIETSLPKLHRFLTGYDLRHIFSDDGKRFNLNSVLCGSEGTLAIVSKIKLKLTAIPTHKSLFVVSYNSFNQALEHAKQLVEFEPEAIETLDDNIVELAKTDIIFNAVREFIKEPKQGSLKAINLIEFVANEAEQLHNIEKSFAASLESYAFCLVKQESDIGNLWNLRKSSVGLLGKVEGIRKPISGVEDTVVPPENLADFIKEFRAILDARGLRYGMFGHIDVGCLHVRPALNLMDEDDKQAYYDIIEQVAELTQKYQGVLWGEHGKGFRSEYVPKFFGETLYKELQKIKACCDPHNQINPGKIATPFGSAASLKTIQSPELRALQDQEINKELHTEYNIPLSCNGNGACFAYSEKDVMCPSYKITRNRIHSPKGRASLLREWLRQLSLAKSNSVKIPVVSKFMHGIKKAFGQYDFSHEVYAAMDGCLGCQACKSQCPVNINVPGFKAKFLEQYHSRYPRSLTDYLVAYSERLGYYQSQWPKINNTFIGNRFSQWLLQTTIGFYEPPLFSTPNLKQQMHDQQIPWLDLNNLPNPDKSVVFVQDWVTSFYEAELVIKACVLLRKLGLSVYVLPWLENGKTFHVKGMLKTFNKIVAKNHTLLRRISEHGLPMIGLDPTMVLTFRFEYCDESTNPANYQVQLLQEWLARQLENLPKPNSTPISENYTLLSHCTEQANCNEANKQWQLIFAHFGCHLQTPKIGCCGMAGSYGHEKNHQYESKGLYDLAWKDYFNSPEKAKKVLVDGFSCRAQVQRFSKIKVKHPLECLLHFYEK